MNPLPEAVVELVDELMAMPGAVAVALGGSHAVGTGDPDSDWDLGLYYRGTIDLSTLAARGTVYPPGSWGRLMNGGAWLRCNGLKVDVLLRDLDAVEHWARRAEQGEFEIDALLGYVAGVPTYLLSAELASCQPLRGEIPSAIFPPQLMAAAPPKWRFCRSFSLEYARMHARRGNVIGTTAQAAKAVVEEAHAVMCERGQWACNEKRLIEAAGLSAVQAIFADLPTEPAGLLTWVDRVEGLLQVSQGEAASLRAIFEGSKRNLTSISPFFIVKNLQASIAHYIERFGFQLDFHGPPDDVYYGHVSRDGIGIMLKAILPDVLPCPNHTRHAWARWDAYIYTLDPDTLFSEFEQRGASFVKELSFIDDGLWGFEVTDADGYVIAFFRVRND